MWLKKRPKLGWFTLQRPQGALTYSEITERRAVLAIAKAISQPLTMQS